MSEESVFKPKDLSVVYGDKEYGEENVKEFVNDVFTLVNIKMLFRPLSKVDFVADNNIVQELAKGFSKKENPFTTAKRIKSYMRDKGLLIK